jgi:dolichyl-phosphate-mannose--protein O-mannosyl transferase
MGDSVRKRHELEQDLIVSLLSLPLFLSPFSLDWWLWLAMTGVAIGLVSSIKWVGLFVTALVGLVSLVSLEPISSGMQAKKAGIT